MARARAGASAGLLPRANRHAPKFVAPRARAIDSALRHHGDWSRHKQFAIRDSRGDKITCSSRRNRRRSSWSRITGWKSYDKRRSNANENASCERGFLAPHVTTGVPIRSIAFVAGQKRGLPPILGRPSRNKRRGAHIFCHSRHKSSYGNDKNRQKRLAALRNHRTHRIVFTRLKERERERVSHHATDRKAARARAAERLSRRHLAATIRGGKFDFSHCLPAREQTRTKCFQKTLKILYAIDILRLKWCYIYIYNIYIYI